MLDSITQSTTEECTQRSTEEAYRTNIPIDVCIISVHLRVHSSVHLRVKKSVNQIFGLACRMSVGFFNAECHRGMHGGAHGY